MNVCTRVCVCVSLCVHALMVLGQGGQSEGNHRESMLCSLCHGPLQSTTDTVNARTQCVHVCVCVFDRKERKKER